MHKKNLLSFAVILTLLIYLGLIFFWNSYARRNINIDAGESNEIFLMQDYVETGKVFSGGTFNSSIYKEKNQLYNNIFSFFELPANKDWELVPLKWWGRLFLKFPLFIFSDKIFFWWLWKITGVCMVLGFFILLFKEIKKSQKIIFVFSALFFLSEHAFELEFASLFLTLASLFLFLGRERKIYLFLYFLFSLYGAILRNEFFLFGSIINLYLLLYIIYKKKFSILPIIFSFYFLFISTLMIGNYYYYWWFLDFWYTIETAAKATWALAGEGVNINETFIQSFINRFSGLIFPDFSIPITYNNIVYTFDNKIGLVVCIFFAFALFFKRNRLLIYPNYFWTLLTLILLWWFLYYGSNPWNYKPENPLSSSYIRYFSVLLLLLWFLLYRNIIPRKTIIVALFSCYVLVIVSGDLVLKYKRMLALDRNIQTVLSLPAWSDIFPAMRMPELLFLHQYYSMQPSWEDNFYFRIMSQWILSEHPFFEKVYSYMQDSNKPVYIYSSNKWINNFFQKRWSKIEKLGTFSKISFK